MHLQEMICNRNQINMFNEDGYGLDMKRRRSEKFLTLINQTLPFVFLFTQIERRRKSLLIIYVNGQKAENARNVTEIGSCQMHRLLNRVPYTSTLKTSNCPSYYGMDGRKNINSPRFGQQLSRQTYHWRVDIKTYLLPINYHIHIIKLTNE